MTASELTDKVLESTRYCGSAPQIVKMTPIHYKELCKENGNRPVTHLCMLNGFIQIVQIPESSQQIP